MKINVIGGGPAGLFGAILFKKLDPSNEIRVFERNRLDDTFGWGVVFSDRTQEHLRAADEETQRRITERFATWDDIDVHYRDDVVRSTGHGFCGLSRKRLLQILHDRAKELGVTMEFEHDVEDVDAYRDCDLLLAADGINSGVRTKYADHFGPSIDLRPNRFVWLGSHQSLDAFTFSFRENEHGLWILHAYQFEPETSTFIVETDPDTFFSSPMPEATEDDILRYCEAVFAEELGGQALLANKSSWIQFRTIKNTRWHHENMVLLGDAVHTAHFSIGSGTKLAMEDVIALQQAFARLGTSDIPAALRAYEEARRGPVESLQRAAQSSLEWFESAFRYMGFETSQFVFSLMTRSMRVTHDNLALRDPDWVEGVDRWYTQRSVAAAGATPADERGAVPPMFTPFSLRGMWLENRVVVSPMCQYSAEDGLPNDWHLVHLGSRAVGGAALVYTEMTDVLRDGRISPGCTGLYDDAHVGAWARVVDFVHANSKAKICVQLAHAGRKGSTQRLWERGGHPLSEGNWPLIAASPIAWSPDHQPPREMTREDMVVVRDAFVKAAERAKRAGFDMIELHMAHGYLLSGFLSPLSNQRTDDYGGSLDNRARYPLEVLDAVREVWRDAPLAVRISATDWVDGGFSGDDAVELASMLKAHGADLIDTSAGQTSTEARPVYGRAFQTPFADRIRNEVGIATMAVGNITTYDDVNTIVLAGRADLVALARAHLADPYFTIHAAREQGYDGVHWPNQYLSARKLRFLVK
jgi:anthraniloyl-CoA monooxygenase